MRRYCRRSRRLIATQPVSQTVPAWLDRGPERLRARAADRCPTNGGRARPTSWTEAISVARPRPPWPSRTSRQRDMGLFSVAVTNRLRFRDQQQCAGDLVAAAGLGRGRDQLRATPNYGQAIVPAGFDATSPLSQAGFTTVWHCLADGTVAAWGAGQTNKGASPYFGQASCPPA